MEEIMKICVTGGAGFIGANFVPENFDKDIIDEIFTVSNEDAIETARRCAKEEGILCGISSGAALSSGASLYAAIEYSKKSENKDKVIVAVLPDTGERYLSVL